MSDFRDKLVLLDPVLVKPTEALSKVPAQRDREDVDEGEQGEGVEQHHCVLQEGQSCVDKFEKRQLTQPF